MPDRHMFKIQSNRKSLYPLNPSNTGALVYCHRDWMLTYDIDNLTAERAIRPFTVHRKNAVFF